MGDVNFVVYLGDNILRTGLSSYVQKFENSSNDAMILLSEVDNPSQFGVAQIVDNKIIKIIEKPKNPPSNFAVIGVYFLTPKIFEIIKTLKPSWRNELEITEALQSLMDSGLKIEYDYVTGWWKDTGTPKDILHANQLILESMSKEKKEEIFLDKNWSIDHSVEIVGPVIIAENCMIKSSKLGPNVSVGKNSILENCSIRDSIVMDDCIINAPIKIRDSIIADGTEIKKNKSDESVYLLGERSQINL